MPSIAVTWGSTSEERERVYPCDALLPDADSALFRAVSVDAPPGTVFRWLCQLKVAPYSYDWIDNFGRTSPRTLTPGAEELARGQRVMTIFELTDFAEDRHLTMVLTSPWSKIFGELALTYLVVPNGGGGSRIIAKVCVRSKGVIARILGVLWPWGDLVMMRKQLLTLKRLAERDAAER